MAFKVLVSDSDQSHANSMKAIIEAECPTATVDTYIHPISDSVTYALNNGYDIISRSTTGLDDDRNEGAGDTGWTGKSVDGDYDADDYNQYEYNVDYNRVGIIHAHGDNTHAINTEPSQLDVICAVGCGDGSGNNDGSYGNGLEFFSDEDTTQSAATARVSGIIAQILTDNPTWNFHDARQALRQTASFYSSGWVQDGGYGAIDKTAAKALSYSDLEIDSPTLQSATASSNVISVSWTNSRMSNYSSTVVAIWDEEPSRASEPVGFYDSTGTSGSYTFYGQEGTYYVTFQSKNESGDYSKIESFDTYSFSLADSWSSVQEDCLAYLKTLIDNIQRYEVDVFKYVDYLTEENVGKLGKKYPAVLIEDSSEEWEGAGAGSYDIMHSVGIYIYNNINIDRLEELLEHQKIIIDEINSDTDLGGNAVCANVISVEKGQYEGGELDLRTVGYNDNISIRRINLQIWERE